MQKTFDFEGTSYDADDIEGLEKPTLRTVWPTPNDPPKVLRIEAKCRTYSNTPVELVHEVPLPDSILGIFRKHHLPGPTTGSRSWYNPRYVRAIRKLIQNELNTVLPQHRAELESVFKAKCEAFLDQLSLCRTPELIAAE